MLMALSHPEAEAWGGEPGLGNRDDAARWMLLPGSGAQGGIAEPLLPHLPPDSLEGGGGIPRF